MARENRENRIELLKALGVTTAFSEEATRVIELLSEEEFNHILSVRAKVFYTGGEAARDKYDHCICEVV